MENRILSESEVISGGLKDYFTYRRDVKHDKSIPIGYENNNPVPEDKIEICREFIRDHMIKIKRSCNYIGSYGFKHEVEYHYSAFHNTHIYIPNGAFIVACIREGITVAQTKYMTPNVSIFAMLSPEAKLRNGQLSPIKETFELELHRRVTSLRRNGSCLFERLPKSFVSKCKRDTEHLYLLNASDWWKL